ncbi:MAG: hypothetical protein ABEH35_07735 [Haloarculaceae archaeon]
MDWRVWLVALAALTAGCNGFALGASTPTATPAPTPEPATPTPGPQQFAPGITEFGIANASAIAAAHRRALRDRPYVWEEQRESATASSDDPRRWNVVRTVTVENATRFHERITRTLHREGGQSRLLREQSAFVASGTNYEQLNTYSDDPQYWSHPTNQTGRQFVAESGRIVRRFLSVEQSNVTVVEDDGERQYLVRGHNLDTDATYPVFNYRVRATISESGLVRSMTATFGVGNAGPTREFRYHFEVRNVGSATVNEPLWVPTVRAQANATGGEAGENATDADEPPVGG